MHVLTTRRAQVHVLATRRVHVLTADVSAHVRAPENDVLQIRAREQPVLLLVMDHHECLLVRPQLPHALNDATQVVARDEAVPIRIPLLKDLLNLALIHLHRLLQRVPHEPQQHVAELWEVHPPVPVARLVLDESLQLLKRKVRVERPHELLQVRRVDPPIPVPIQQLERREQLVDLILGQLVAHPARVSPDPPRRPSPS
eukprot:CAMPEP_0206242630 /NCGR_PEP_ID=MMETSP0047_2-20121206/17163_1 /ASSEMBLY_ACC=CAM_ASM_000192 /TAXON_ID=195065 /ORGANISM="Chroomonas mesostigmatica_cf, Strain CCMP1168" /LENGTH=199 /DNA_ID=CAMNT_0053667669 /DNA_START=436 /DNA_END=1032 /DNA_ORIENTATION=-